MAKQSICLCMIVKNEAPVICRCLDSVRAIIDHWIIVDTGSTDGTQEIIRDHLRDLPGELHERPWRDFAHNRTEALELARDRADYTLIIDADDALEIQPGLSVPALTADSYTLDIHDTSINYQRTQLVRSALPWRYEGVLHEYLACDGAGPAGHLDGVVMRRNHDGARRRDPETYRRDVRMLEAALADNPTDFLRSRYTFYLAQSYRDCGEKQKALEHYLKRAELGFWQEEIFVALYEAAKIMEAEGRAEQEVIDAYLRASEALPARAEALHGASRFCRYKGRHEEGYQIAKLGLDIPVRADALFLEVWIYDYGLLDELAVNAYWSGKYSDCLTACERLFRENRIPHNMRERVEQNRKFAADKLEALQATLTDELRRDKLAHSPKNRPPRYAIVTPYYREDASVLKRCLESVSNQTVPVDHFVIADGFPQEWISKTGVRHIQLDKPHADYGGTPRAVGCLLAISEGYDAIGLLDADNWLEPDHTEHCLEAANAFKVSDCDFVVARSQIVRPDGSLMNISAQDIGEHVDTNCFFFLKGSFHALPIWALMPRELSAVGDRFFYQAVREMKLSHAITSRVTVNYTSLWEIHYRALGEVPPTNAKSNVGGVRITDWIRTLSSRELEIAERLMRVSLSPKRDHSSLPTKLSSTTVVSFYMENIPAELIEIQREILEKFTPPDFKILQIMTNKSHEDSLDHFMQVTDSEIIIFMDIDCIPLNSEAIPNLAAYATRGGLAGCVQRASHIENEQHLYVGPFCMALSKRLWIELGCPSFKQTERGDVGEEITYLCEMQGKTIHMIWPSFVEDPVWNLTSNLKFGFNTEYGKSFLHTFGVRHEESRRRFVQRCRSLCLDAEVSYKSTTEMRKKSQVEENMDVIAEALPDLMKTSVCYFGESANMQSPYTFSADWFSRNAKFWPAVLHRTGVIPTNVLEIGSYEGRSAVWFVEAVLGDKGGAITCVDLWADGSEADQQNMSEIESNFDSNMAKAMRRFPSVSLRKEKGKSVAALAGLVAEGLSNSYDIVYVDGSHFAAEVMTDAVLAFELCKIGGLIIFDDYLGARDRELSAGPKLALDAFTACFHRKVEIIPEGDYQLYVRKSSS